MVLLYYFLDEILKCDLLDERYQVLFPCGTVSYMLFKMVLTFESVDEILKCDHSNESY